MEDDDKLPLHDEAQAREKWRGGETIVKRGSESESLPASEVDNAAMPDGSDGEDSPGPGWAGLRPPD